MHIYGCIQNYSTTSSLSFGYKGKATTATSKVNMFKTVSQAGTDTLFVVMNLGIACRFCL